MNNDKQKSLIEKLCAQPPIYNKDSIDSLMNNFKQMTQKISSLDVDLNLLTKRIDDLEESITENYSLMKPLKKEIKKNRRTANLINRHYQCPYEKCDKTYGTDISLNLHIRLKHNGGSKIEREELAKQIVEAQFSDTFIPKHNLVLPPNFINDFCYHHQKYVDNLESKYNKKIIL